MMERRVRGNSHARCGRGEKTEIISKSYLSVSWRPSDIEQRDGRILRQGNENSEVNIFRYVTKGTFDAYLWQIQEQKLKYISQVMTGKSISRSCEDMDETVLSAAEVKAIATSNPLLAEKMEVDNEVTRLKLLKANWNNERIILKRNVESKYPALIANCEQKIEALKKDIGLRDKTASQDFIMNIDGKSFDERVKAGERLLMMSKINDIAINGTPIEVGTYRGFKILLARTGFEQMEVQIKGALAYRVDLGNSELGCITRIENAVERIDGVLDDTVRKLEDAKVQLEEAKAEVDKSFEFEEPLNEFSAHQAEINTKLEFKELREQDTVIVDESGQGNEREYQAEEVKCEMAIAER